MKVALGVTGGIAAYKAAEIVRLLQDRGIRVQVIMTRAAQEFVRPLTFAALSGEKVITGMFSPGEEHDSANIDSAIEHIAVAQSIDALLVAPATADVLAHFAQGIASDFLTTLYLATTAPVVVAPAMNVNMWNHPATQANLEILRQRGVKIVEPGSGYLACGMTGSGRLAENEAIVAAVLEALGASQDLAGETVLDHRRADARKDRSRALSHEPLQRTHGLCHGRSRAAPRCARAAGQRTDGADAAGSSRGHARGIGRADARCRAQSCCLRPPSSSRPRLSPITARSLFPGRRSNAKVRSRSNSNRPPTFSRKSLCRKQSQIVVGFAAETENVLENARQKLAAKQLDAIVVNDVSREGIGFDSDRNEVTIITHDEVVEVPETTKWEVAQRVLDQVVRLRQRRKSPVKA